MKRRGKQKAYQDWKRVAAALILALLLLPTLLPVTAHASGTAKAAKTREIAVVFDNSGSMYSGGNAAWCRAGYAIEVFAAMMNENDRLSVYPMWTIEARGQSYSQDAPLTLAVSDDLSVIRDIYTPAPSGTPIETIAAAERGLNNSPAEEKWLIVLTDGSAFFENGSSLGGATKARLTEKLTQCSQSVNVLYLGIGSDAAMPDTSGSDNVFYAYNASRTEDILAKLTAMSNLIFGRDELPVSGKSLEFDLPMSKLIVFVQGEDISGITLTDAAGQTLNAAGKPYTPSYGTRGAGGQYEGICSVDESLHGVVATYENCEAGTYQLDYSGNASSAVVYYEPDVDLSAFLTNEKGETVSPDELYPGTYQLNFGMVDKNGNLTSSKLLGDTHYTITYEVDGKEETIESNESGTVPVTLRSQSKLNAKLVVTYLSGYRIEKDNAALGWPSDGLQVTVHPESTVELKLDVPQNYVVISEKEDAQPMKGMLLEDGSPMPAELLEKAAFTADAGSIPCEVEEAADGSFLVHLNTPDTLEPCVVTVTCRAVGEDKYGEPFDLSQTQTIEFATYPRWVRFAVIAAAIALLVTLFLLFMGMKVLPKKIRIAKTTFTVGSATVTGVARAEYSGGNKRKGRLIITSPKYNSNPLAKCGLAMELEAVDNRWTRHAERKAKVVSVSPVNGNTVESIKVGTTLYSRDPETGRLVCTKKNASPEIGNNRACNVSGRALDSTGNKVAIALGVNLKFGK